MAIVFNDSLNASKELNLKFKNFKGVDFANTKLNVAMNRATDTRNMIHSDSINRKRMGWIQRAFLHDVNGTPLKINGFWEMKDKNGVIHSIVHAGNKIFRIFFGDEVLNTKFIDLTKTNTYSPTYSTLESWNNKIVEGIKDVKSYGIVRGNRLYIFAGGAYLVYGTWNEEICSLCNGAGTITDCKTCNGLKKVVCTTCNKDGSNKTGLINCTVCGGDGKINCQNHHTTTEGGCTTCEEGYVDCEECNGSGVCQICITLDSCAICGGTGRLDCSLCDNTGHVYPCYECGAADSNEANPNCPVCGGLGGQVECPNCRTAEGGYTCPECNGIVSCPECEGTKKCRECNGSGKVVCSDCKGNFQGTIKACSVCNTIPGLNVIDCTNEKCTDGKVKCTNNCQNGYIACSECSDLASTKVCETCQGKGIIHDSEEKNYELRLVQDNIDTYIPTTTIGIACIGSELDGNRVSLEEGNMLSNRRKNKLVWAKTTSEVNVMTPDYFSQAFFEGSDILGAIKNKYCYAGSLSGEFLKYIRISFTIKDVQYEATIDYESNKLYTGWVKILSANKLNEFIENQNLNSLDSVDISIRHYKGNIQFRVALGSNETLSIDEIYISVEDYSYQLDCVKIDSNYPITVKSNGYLINEENYILDYNTGILKFPNSTIFEDSIYTPKVVGESNIVVEFTPVFANYQIQANKINNCRFGVMFGYNETEYLFASGNPDFPNVDWHTVDRDNSETETNLTEYEDLTYFGSSSYAVCGGEMSAIVGYALLGDETLAVLKEESPNEPTMYIRKAVFDNVITPDGMTLDYKKVYFPQYSTSSTEGCLNFHTIENLAGDKIFTSKNGIFGIVLSENIKSEERFARERSRFVNPVLIKEDLSKAIAIVYDNRYYLAINNKMYIADSRFKSQYDVEMDDTFSYEFWVWEWTNANITTLFVKNGDLWFGTDDGKICNFPRFRKEEDDLYFVDKAYTFTNLNGGSLTFADNVFTINSKYKLEEDDEIMIVGDKSPIYEVISERSDIVTISKDTIAIKSDAFINNIQNIEENEPVLVNNITNNVANTLIIGREYYIKNINFALNTFKLADKDGKIVDFTDASFIKFDLIKKLSNVNKITKKLGTTNSFKLKNTYIQGETKEIITSYNGIINTTLIGAFPQYKNVESIWYTPVVDMGSSDYVKNIKYLTVVPDAVSQGEIKAGIVTKRNDKEIFFKLDTKGVDTYDLEDLGFTQFSFDCSVFARAYTRKVKIKNASFVQLFFASTDRSDCVVNELSIIYTVGRKNKGVRI